MSILGCHRRPGSGTPIAYTPDHMSREICAKLAPKIFSIRIATPCHVSMMSGMGFENSFEFMPAMPRHEVDSPFTTCRKRNVMLEETPYNWHERREGERGIGDGRSPPIGKSVLIFRLQTWREC